MFSVIVPVYNIKAYLDECIQSVLQQTYLNWELILVDDGSMDGSAAVCDKYANEDDRVRVIHKVNGGPSSARNAGLRCAVKDWILYLDGDDKLVFNALQNFSELVTNEIDVVVGTVLLWGKDVVREPQEVVEIDFTQNAQHCYAQLIKMFSNPIWSPWRSIYRKDFLLKNELYYTEGILAEDMELFPRIAMCAKSIRYNPEPFYFYRTERPGSTMATVKRKLLTDTCQIAATWLDRMEKMNGNPLFKAVLLDRMLRAAISYLPKVGGLTKSEYNCYIQKLKQLYPFAKKCKSMTTKYYYCCLYFLGPKLTKVLICILKKPFAVCLLEQLKRNKKLNV